MAVAHLMGEQQLCDVTVLHGGFIEGLGQVRELGSWGGGRRGVGWGSSRQLEGN